MLNGSGAVSYPKIPILLTEPDEKASREVNQPRTRSESVECALTGRTHARGCR